ncbi:PIDD1 [Branchiostoma lanceolatum]|uniref:PIDD1 protein n=1 Tax=Branchiostoma lanceolatum TaxID=7740 RepID=A0A8K0ACN7_BRALA|nr:PIDD1 [Branchiostoma lanceolatum]
MEEMMEEAKRRMTEEVATHAAQVDSAAWEAMGKMLREVTKATARSVAWEEHDEWHRVMEVMEGLVDEISMATAKSVALEVDEELRLGDTVPDEYNKQFTYRIFAAAPAMQYLDLPAGVRLAIPRGATRVDTSVISAVLNPHGCDQTVALGDEELLVSDILEMRPAGLRFARPVELTIPHALPRFHREKEYVVKTSEDSGRTWRNLSTRSQHQSAQHFATVEVSHFSEFAVVARPLERYHSVGTGLASVLRSSPQTDVEINLPRDCGPQQVGFKVLPVDADTLTCAAAAEDGVSGISGMSHIVRFCKNLLLSSPATVVLPLTPGDRGGRVPLAPGDRGGRVPLTPGDRGGRVPLTPGDRGGRVPLTPGDRGGRVRVLSCDDSGRWEDITNSVEAIVLEGSKVAFRTDQLRAGFAAVSYDILEDPTRTIDVVTKNIRARLVRIVIFKKWREEGVMTARLECVLRDRVEDRISQAELREGFESGTPTPPIVLMEGEQICATFEGRIRPEKGTNSHYGVNFTFHCERPRVLQFYVRLADGGRGAASTVQVYPGRLEGLPPKPPTPVPVPLTRPVVPSLQQTAPAPVVQQAPPSPKTPVQWPKPLATAEITPPVVEQAPPSAKIPVRWPVPLLTAEVTPPTMNPGKGILVGAAPSLSEETKNGGPVFMEVPRVRYNSLIVHMGTCGLK